MHHFTRDEVHRAVTKAKERNADGWLFCVREPMNLAAWKPTSSAVTNDFKKMSAGQVVAEDQECLEAAAVKAMGGMAALDALLPQCPLCGGRPMNFGPTIGPILGKMLKDRLGRAAASKHTPTCPFLEGWKAVVTVLLGEQEAEYLNSFERLPKRD